MSAKLTVFGLFLTLAGLSSAVANVDNSSSDKGLMKHTIKEVRFFDSVKMTKVIQRECKALNTPDDEEYFNAAAVILGQTILVQHHFHEREAAIREFKGKLEQSDYVSVIPRTAEQLLTIVSTGNTADQASATLALTNLVIEIKALYQREKESREELKALLGRIRDAKIEISESAQRYAKEQLIKLVSPSDEAEAVLGKLTNS